MVAQAQALAQREERDGTGEGGAQRSGAPSSPRPSEVVARPWPPPGAEVDPKPERRRYTAAFKRRILQEADQCETAGEIGALLRREGLYGSHLHRWRKLREKGESEGLEDQRRGPKPNPNTPMARRLQELERDNQRLKRKLKRAETIIEVQKNSRARARTPLLGEKLPVS